MNEINSLGATTYYAGLQNTANKAAKDQQSEKVKAKKLSFSDLLKPKDELAEETVARGFPAEIAHMSVEDAAIYLKDAVDIAGDALEENLTKENIQHFKTCVQQFVKFVIQNNYEVTKKGSKTKAGVNLFSNYQLPLHKEPKNYKIKVINEKLNNLTRGMIMNQMGNLQILAQVDEIKGLIVDFMAS